MIENQEKEKLIDMKVELEQGGKTCMRISWVCLGIGNPRLGVEVFLGVEIASLGEPMISMKTPEDKSRVRLGEPSLTLV